MKGDVCLSLAAMARAKRKEARSETALTEEGTVRLCELVTRPSAAGVTGILMEPFLHAMKGVTVEDAA